MGIKLWDPFSREWKSFFLPQKLLNFIQSEAILRSPSVARRSKAKRGIKFKSEWGKKNDFHSRRFGSHSEMPILFNMELYSIATTLWDSLNEVLHFIKHTKITKIQLRTTKHLHTFSYISHILLICSTVIIGVFALFCPYSWGPWRALAAILHFSMFFLNLLNCWKWSFFQY